MTDIATGVPIRVAATADEMGDQVARLIVDEIDDAVRRGVRCVIGCPSGRSPMPVYRALELIVTARRLDLSGVIVAMMDDYLEQDADGVRRVPARAAHSCEGFAREQILARLNAAVGHPLRRIPPDALWIPDPDEPEAFDAALESVGGVSLFLLASGTSDGHVAFNPTGSSAESRTRIVRLAEQTRRDNLATFPFGSLDEVPVAGVTVGIATIRDLSRRAVLVAHGAEKAAAVRRIAGASGYDPDWPATVLADCRRPLLVVDRAAAALLDPTIIDGRGL